MADEPLKTAVLTDVGIAKLDAAYQAGTKVTIAEMALGDSNLEYVVPDPAFTQLVNEFGRQPINEGNTSDTWINAIVYVDSTQFAGKSILEFGLYDDEGDLIVYSSYTPSVIPAVGQNYIQLEIECSVDLYNASAVTIEVTPIYPQATELERGIAKIATDEDIAAGVDDEKIVTAKKLKKPLTDYLRKDAKATLTDNDSVGNANLVFNHIGGVPQQDGSSGRLNVGTDIDDAVAWFGLASNVKAGIAAELTKIFNATLTDFDVLVSLKENGQRVFSPNNRNISDAITGTSSTVYASQKAVKSVNDKFNSLFVGTKGTNGYQKLPNGLIIQWGFGATDATGKAKANFAIAFPNACLSVVATHKGSGPCNVISNEITKTYVTFILNNLPDLVGNSGWWAYYVAIGY